MVLSFSWLLVYTLFVTCDKGNSVYSSTQHISLYQVFWMPREQSSRRGGCGLTKHGKPNPDGNLALCFACGRAGGRNTLITVWRHVGSGPFWWALEQWSASIGAAWVHARDLTTEPVVDGECMCSRSDCVVLMYRRFSKQQQEAEKGSLEWLRSILPSWSPPLDELSGVSKALTIQST